MNDLQQRCVGFSKHLRKLALGYPESVREHRRLLRGAVQVHGYAELLAGEVTPISARLFRAACDDYLKTLAGVGLEPKRLAQSSASTVKHPGKRARPVVQGIVVLFFPATNKSPPKRKNPVASGTSKDSGKGGQQKG